MEIQVSLIRDVVTSWRLRNIEEKVRDAEYELAWLTADWETYFTHKSIEYPDGVKRQRQALHNEEHLIREKEEALKVLKEAWKEARENPDSMEADRNLDRARDSFFSADKSLTTFHARRAYHYGQMRNAQKRLEKQKEEQKEREQARSKLRRRLRLRRKLRMSGRPRLSRAEWMTLMGIGVSVGLALLGLWLTSAI